jgi:hypothetical protein
MDLPRPIYLLLTLLLAGCATSTTIGPPPRVIAVLEDLRFTWRPPIGFPEFETTISAGTYVRIGEDGTQVFYSSNSGLVSKTIAGHNAEKKRGGIGYLKGEGRFFVWKADVSQGGLMILGPLTVIGHKGDPLQLYLGRVPTDLESKLKIEP